MTRLEWGITGDRFYEAGVDRGVLYPVEEIGVPWNGLISVSEDPVGGESKPYYLDGVKYLTVPGIEEFAGTLEAFTYPDEFSECDGSMEAFSGLFLGQQRRKPFNLSYRTGIGNDISGLDRGYKIHLVYNALASPSQRSYATVSESVEPLNFSWSFSTTPVFASTKFKPTSHVTIDSRKTNPIVMGLLENRLYGSISTNPSIIFPEELIVLFESDPRFLEIHPNVVNGLALLSEGAFKDLLGDLKKGLYTAPSETRLIASGLEGLYHLEN